MQQTSGPMQFPLPNASHHTRAALSFVPPSWHELAPLLYASVTLWLCILFTAIARSAFYAYFQSDNFRSFVKAVKHSGRSRGPLIRLARVFRNIRTVLVKYRFPQTTTALYFGLPRFVGGVIICILYIIDTYVRGVPIQFYIFQCAYGAAISANLILSFVYTERPIVFAFSLRTIIECLSIPSLLFSSGARWLNFNFLQAYCILMQWATLEKHDIVMRNSSALPRLLTNLFLQLLTFLFVTSCGVQFFELLGDPVQALRTETFQITWANAVYFAVVTLMTVGYGDFVPYTLLGRMWIVLHIIFAAYLVSKEISLLIEALKSMRRGGGSYVTSTGTNHVVVTGRVKWEFLQQFVTEFLADPSNLDTRVIVLTSNPTWSDDEWHKFVSTNPFFDHHLLFLDGSALRVDDLSRAQVRVAKGVFVLADPHRRDPYKEDSDILKTVLTIRNYSGTVPVYTLNTLHESSFQFGIAMEHLEPAPHPNFSSSALLPLSGTLLNFPQTPALAPRNDMRHSDYRGGGSGEMRYSATQERLASHGLYSIDEAVGGHGDVHIRDHETPASARALQKKRRSVMRKSENLCMQELETVLLAENTFCNGLSTLIANATLRVAPQSHRSDQPWLLEYKLGAECSIQQFVIRKEMDGIQFRSISTLLQDYGLVMLAIRRFVEKNWTLLSPTTLLEKDMSVMALSYHDHTVIDGIVDIASADIRERKISLSARRKERAPASSMMPAGPRHGSESMFKRSSSQNLRTTLGRTTHDMFADHEIVAVPLTGSGPSSSTEIMLQGTGMERDESPQNSNAGEAVPPSNEAQPGSQQMKITRSLSTPAAQTTKREPRQRSKDMKTGDNGMESTEGLKFRSSGESRRSKAVSTNPSRRGTRRKRKIVYSNIDKLPVALRGHVIVCLDGESPLLNLDLLLKRIWMRRTGQRKRTPVVVIHPRFPKNFSRRLGNDLEGLFLLQGNSLSLETLRQAQYQNARAFLIMASESKDDMTYGSTDSKSIFTVMTLDSLLSGLNAFVCCVLDAEESLQLLRAPRQARRVGQNLRENREPDIFAYERSSFADLPRRTASSTSFLRNISSPYGQRYQGYSTFQSKGSLLGPFLGASKKGGSQANRNVRPGGKGISRSNSMLFQKRDSSDDDDSEEDRPLLPDQRSREELYERQRYASGEMVISSLFTALLARDYTDPGYIRLIRQLIGTSSGSKGSWIRQVEIPETWISIEKAFGGRTYRETSIRLLELGCIALGLYRSGEASVRVETKSEQFERRTDGNVYGQEEEISLLRPESDSRNVASWMLNPEDISNRRTSRTGSFPRGLDTGSFLRGLDLGSNGDVIDAELLNEADAQLDYYTCPTTNRRIYYCEYLNGENVLPYVYTCPEPFSLVSSSDFVFVLCEPNTRIPANWGEDD